MTARRCAALAVLCVFVVAAFGAACRAPAPPPRTLYDLSGLAWLEGDTFVAVHDAKQGEEDDRPRVSLVHLPRGPEGIGWTPLAVDWPAAGASHDLESVARIPGTRSFLLAESGDDGGAPRRLFLADAKGDALRILTAVPWPRPVVNVEGTAVARVGGHLVFVYAERAHGRDSTRIAWAPLTLDPLAFGAFEEVTLAVDDPVGADARPVSAIEVDPRGRLYVAAAADPERDDGPFRSVVWDVGAVVVDAAGRVRVALDPRPAHVATLDGLKVESLAAREESGGRITLFAGTDDEHYGAVLRPLPPRAAIVTEP